MAQNPTILSPHFRSQPPPFVEPDQTFVVEVVVNKNGGITPFAGQVRLELVTLGGSGTLQGTTAVPQIVTGQQITYFRFPVWVVGSGSFQLRAVIEGGSAPGHAVFSTLSNVFDVEALPEPADLDALDASAEDDLPVEIYEFHTDKTTYRFGTAAHQVFDGLAVYVPTAIRRSGLEQTTDFARSALQVHLPRSNPLAQELLENMGLDARATLTLRRGHGRVDLVPNWALVWKGRMVSFSASGEEVTLEMEPVFTTLARPGLRARYEITCRHVLYGQGCGVDKLAHRLEATVHSIDGLRLAVTFPSDPLAGGRKLQNGLIERQGPSPTQRFVGRKEIPLLGPDYPPHTFRLVVDRPWPDLAVGEKVWVYYGCDRSAEQCQNFDNFQNFGGFPKIPGRNPFSSETGGI